MGNAIDDYYDDGDEMPEGAIWCDRCQGSGIANCYCGGDQCYCLNNGEMECTRCDGQGYYIPTAKQIAFEAEMRTVIAQAMSAGTAETPKVAQGEARQRGPEDAPAFTQPKD